MRKSARIFLEGKNSLKKLPKNYEDKRIECSGKGAVNDNGGANSSVSDL